MTQSINKTIGGLLIVLLAAGMFLLFKGDVHLEAPTATARIAVIDSAGRTVDIPARPQRVIVLNVSNLELFYAAGGKVIGRTVTDAMPTGLGEALAQVPTVGTTPNPSMEQIVTLKPDLILGTTMPFHHNLIPVLDKGGIPILLQSLDNYQQILDTLQFYGQLTGQPDKAAQEITAIESRYQNIKEQVENRPKPKTLIIWGSPESFYMATSHSFTGDLVRRLGALNLADQEIGATAQMNYIPLSMEYVAKENPDVILVITHSADETVGDKFQHELARHPAWNGLKAVENNRVHRLPYRLFAVNPGTQVGEAMAVLAQLLYPGVKAL